MNAKVLEKTIKRYFSIRIGNWELCLWKILYEAVAKAETTVDEP
jgi:hypothetical protein